MADSSSQGSAGRVAQAALLALMVLVAAVAVVLVGDSRPAAAGELATFSSCQDLTGWMSAAQRSATGGAGFGSAESAVAVDDAATSVGGDDGSAVPTMAAGRAGSDAEESAGAPGSTNVIVEGIDELDVVEQLDDGRILAVGQGSLHLVDVSAARSLASLPVPAGAQVSFDAAHSQIWVAGSDGNGTQVVRVALDGDRLEPDGTWSTGGMLLTARRSAEGFHAIVTEGFGGAVPFAGGPVPCDEVLHPTATAAPEATLIATLPATGALEPTATTEIVGAGRFVHLTDDAVFVATPLWEPNQQPSTSLHRFDLATLTHTGSGRVEGTLLNEFALSAHDGYLRVAVTHGGGGRMVIMDDAGMGVTDAGSSAAVASDVTEPMPVEPMPVDPGIGGGIATPPPPSGEPLNEVVVLDTDGDLDVVGRSARFGLPGETLHGIRFVGTIAYAVTFLQTDPFYVLDLADPATPRVVGEVKLPGFSSYLHPVGDGLVVGFGPGADGRATAKLFDVSNPAAPAVVDSLTLGDDSPVAYDHHAFLGLGDGHFAVPATTWTPVEPAGCNDQVRATLEQRAIGLEQEAATAVDEAQRQSTYRQLDAIWSDPCLNPQVEAVTSIVEVRVSGRSLDVASRTDVRSGEPGERVLRTSGAWVLYSSLSLTVVDADGQHPVPLA